MQKSLRVWKYCRVVPTERYLLLEMGIDDVTVSSTLIGLHDL